MGITNPGPESPAVRARRLTDPLYVRCPANCDPKRGCPQCTWNGTVLKGSLDETCLHQMRHHRKLGNCLNEIRCAKCGKTETLDSSD